MVQGACIIWQVSKSTRVLVITRACRQYTRVPEAARARKQDIRVGAHRRRVAVDQVARDLVAVGALNLVARVNTVARARTRPSCAVPAGNGIKALQVQIALNGSAA